MIEGLFPFPARLRAAGAFPLSVPFFPLFLLLRAVGCPRAGGKPPAATDYLFFFPLSPSFPLWFDPAILVLERALELFPAFFSRSDRIVIAHRLFSSFGGVVEQGRHDELLGQGRSLRFFSSSFFARHAGRREKERARVRQSVLFFSARHRLRPEFKGKEREEEGSEGSVFFLLPSPPWPRRRKQQQLGETGAAMT